MEFSIILSDWQLDISVCDKFILCHLHKIILSFFFFGVCSLNCCCYHNNNDDEKVCGYTYMWNSCMKNMSHINENIIETEES